MAKKSSKQASYGNAYHNSASPANSVPGRRSSSGASSVSMSRRRILKQNAMLRGDPDGVEGGRGDGDISRAENSRRKENQTTDSNQ